MAVRVLQGHAIDVLASLPAQSTHMVCTSPPYWQARAYGTPPQTWADGWVGELGREPLPEQYIGHLVDVFRAVKRVLRNDGCCFVNLGDTYWSDPGGQNGGTRNGLDYGAGRISQKVMTANAASGRQDRTSVKHDRLKPGDLCGIPWAFAFALQADGWVLRSAVTWIKTSPMPESIQGTRWERCKVKVGASTRAKETQRYAAEGPSSPQGVWAPGGMAGTAEWADCPGCPKCAANEGLVLRRGSGRPTSATEMVFLFTKGMGTYFYDLEGTRVPNAESTVRIHSSPSVQDKAGAWKVDDVGNGHGGLGNGPDHRTLNGRNAWNWMTFKPAPSSLEHYAGYPPELPQFCIKAGTSERGVCPTCGAPWARIVERRSLERYELPTDHEHYRPGRYPTKQGGEPGTDNGQRVSESTTLGWRPTCPPACHQGRPPVPAVVLDPFAGAGTTLLVADRLGRDAVGVELQPTYVELSRKRLIGDAPLFMDVSVEGAAG